MIVIIRPCQSCPLEVSISVMCFQRNGVPVVLMNRSQVVLLFQLVDTMSSAYSTFFIALHGSAEGDHLCTVQDRNEIPQHRCLRLIVYIMVLQIIA